jgi:hypothetical protein
MGVINNLIVRLNKDKLLIYFIYLVAISLAILIGISIPQWNRLFLILSITLILAISIYPIIILLMSVLLDFWITYTPHFRILGFPIRNYLILYLVMIIFITISINNRRLKLDKQNKKIITLIILFASLILFVDVIHSTSIIATLDTYLGRLIVPIFIAICLLFFIKNKLQLKIFIYVMIFGMFVSAFVGVMQFFQIDFFWKIREHLSPFEEGGIYNDLLARVRIPGLALFSIPFSYQLCSIAPLIFGIIINSKLSFFGRNYLRIAFLVIILALLFTLARSAIAGSVIGIVMIIYLSKIRFKFLKIALISIIFIFILFSITVFERRFSVDESTLQRIPMALAGLKIGLNHPLGVGRGHIEKYAEEFSELKQFVGGEMITSTHNQFLSTFSYYGIVGLILLLLFYRYIFKNLFYLRKNLDDDFLKGLCIGLIGSFVSYIINSLFHNAGPFVGDVFNWYIIGLVFVLIKLSRDYAKS